jgi:hypothetical protein
MRLDAACQHDRAAEILGLADAMNLIAVAMEGQPLQAPQLFEVGVYQEFKPAFVGRALLGYAGIGERFADVVDAVSDALGSKCGARILVKTAVQAGRD